MRALEGAWVPHVNKAQPQVTSHLGEQLPAALGAHGGGLLDARLEAVVGHAGVRRVLGERAAAARGPAQAAHRLLRRVHVRVGAAGDRRGQQAGENPEGGPAVDGGSVRHHRRARCGEGGQVQVDRQRLAIGPDCGAARAAASQARRITPAQACARLVSWMKALQTPAASGSANVRPKPTAKPAASRPAPQAIAGRALLLGEEIPARPTP